MLKHSFVVHSGDSMNGDVFFMEVSDQVNRRPIKPVHTKPVRPSVHTDPSRKRSFSKTL